MLLGRSERWESYNEEPVTFCRSGSSKSHEPVAVSERPGRRGLASSPPLSGQPRLPNARRRRRRRRRCAGGVPAALARGGKRDRGRPRLADGGGKPALPRPGALGPRPLRTPGRGPRAAGTAPLRPGRPRHPRRRDPRRAAGSVAQAQPRGTGRLRAARRVRRPVRIDLRNRGPTRRYLPSAGAPSAGQGRCGATQNERGGLGRAPARHREVHHRLRQRRRRRVGRRAGPDGVGRGHDPHRSAAATTGQSRARCRGHQPAANSGQRRAPQPRAARLAARRYPPADRVRQHRPHGPRRPWQRDLHGRGRPDPASPGGRQGRALHPRIACAGGRVRRPSDRGRRVRPRPPALRPLAGHLGPAADARERRQARIAGHGQPPAGERARRLGVRRRRSGPADIGGAHRRHRLRGHAHRQGDQDRRREPAPLESGPGNQVDA